VFRRVLIANRGEIAMRVMRTCKRLGIETVAVFSDADRDAMHTACADRAEYIGEPRATESYLRVDKIIAAALASGADAIHPGYGFLAENADFSDRCADAGMVFIGPSGNVIRTMGDKAAARARMTAAGIAVIPGSDGAIGDAQAEACAQRIGYPVMVKASAGGGGKGLRRVESPDALGAALERVRPWADKRPPI